MKENGEEIREIRDLLRRLRLAEDPAPGEPDPGLLAAWLDGSASPEEAEIVEKALAANPGLAEGMLALRDLGEEGPEPAPAGFAAAVKKALAGVGPGAEGARPGRLQAAVLWLTAAAAVLVVAALAFQLGRSYTDDRTSAEEAQKTTEEEVLSELRQDWGVYSEDLDVVVGLMMGSPAGGSR
jgi:hypothetical protein